MSRSLVPHPQMRPVSASGPELAPSGEPGDRGALLDGERPDGPVQHRVHRLAENPPAGGEQIVALGTHRDRDPAFVAHPSRPLPMTASASMCLTVAHASSSVAEKDRYRGRSFAMIYSPMSANCRRRGAGPSALIRPG